MIGGSFLSLLPKGLFNFAVDAGVCGQMSMVLTDDKVRKRRRDVGSCRTPRLVVSRTNASNISCGSRSRAVRDNNDDDNGDSDRPRKRFRGQSRIIDVFVKSLPSSSSSSSSSSPCTSACGKGSTCCSKSPAKKGQTSDLIKKLPGDVVAHCLSFLGSTEDRHSLQSTCKLFNKISSADPMLSDVDVFGDLETGKGGIIQETDTPATAAASLEPFARAGNLEALYM